MKTMYRRAAVLCSARSLSSWENWPNSILSGATLTTLSLPPLQQLPRHQPHLWGWVLAFGSREMTCIAIEPGPSFHLMVPSTGTYSLIAWTRSAWLPLSTRCQSFCNPWIHRHSPHVAFCSHSQLLNGLRYMGSPAGLLLALPLPSGAGSLDETILLGFWLFHFSIWSAFASFSWAASSWRLQRRWPVLTVPLQWLTRDPGRSLAPSKFPSGPSARVGPLGPAFDCVSTMGFIKW